MTCLERWKKQQLFSLEEKRLWEGMVQLKICRKKGKEYSVAEKTGSSGYELQQQR